MNIQQFQYVLAVVDLKNFEAAAKKCFVTQSTLSTMIGRLEEEIGIKIFNRRTKPVSITTAGKVIIDKLRVVVNEIDALKNIIQELKGEMAGRLVIGVIPTIAPYLLPLFLEDFVMQFPKVKIAIREMTTAQIRANLKIRTIDIGILALPISDKELEEQILYSEPFMIYDCRKKKAETAISIENLDYSKLFLLQEGHCLRTQVQQICELSNQTTEEHSNLEFESGSMDSLLRVTKAQKGMTIIPHLACINLPKEEHELLVPFETLTPVRQVGTVTHKFFVKKQLLRALQRIIKKVVARYINKWEGEEKTMIPY